MNRLSSRTPDRFMSGDGVELSNLSLNVKKPTDDKGNAANAAAPEKKGNAERRALPERCSYSLKDNLILLSNAVRSGVRIFFNQPFFKNFMVSTEFGDRKREVFVLSFSAIIIKTVDIKTVDLKHQSLADQAYERVYVLAATIAEMIKRSILIPYRLATVSCATFNEAKIQYSNLKEQGVCRTAAKVTCLAIVNLLVRSAQIALDPAIACLQGVTLFFGGAKVQGEPTGTAVDLMMLLSNLGHTENNLAKVETWPSRIQEAVGDANIRFGIFYDNSTSRISTSMSNLSTKMEQQVKNIQKRWNSSFQVKAPSNNPQPIPPSLPKGQQSNGSQINFENAGSDTPLLILEKAVQGNKPKNGS